jgi:3-ketosteroid 9alpha-monooxygenase subunit B
MTAPDPGRTRDHGFHPLRVSRVVRETTDTSSFVFEIPDDLCAVFAYDAGQYCTFRLVVDGRPVERQYSMSSTPGLDAELQVTVKRVPGGVMSNALNDTVAAGDVVEVSPPTGRFRLSPAGTDIVAFSGGSGITPVFSILKSALATTTRHVRLLYANRDADGVIFADALTDLAEAYPDRFTLTHHHDAEHGYVTADVLRAHARAAPDAEHYLCGPAPFMDLVEATLLADGVDAGRIHVERFETAAPPAPTFPAHGDGLADASQVTIRLDGTTKSTEHRAGTTILQVARQLGLSAPFSCEAGNCATCMAKIVEGRAEMLANNALTDEEVDEGWVLTCQAVPATPVVRVVYGYEET